MKATLQGLDRDDLALLLHGLNAIYVADMAKRRDALEAKVRAELLKFGVTDVQGKG